MAVFEIPSGGLWDRLHSRLECKIAFFRAFNDPFCIYENDYYSSDLRRLRLSYTRLLL
jgi:hypothetical protein